MDVVNTLFTQNYTQFESLMWNYGAFTNKIQNINALTGLGEAKFEVNGSDYTLPWCRPQNDGPAFRSSAFMRFSTYLLKNGGDPARVIQLYTSTIKPDLDYVSQNYATSNTCDLWEEQVGLHFFTQMAQRRAMKEGIVFATLLNDTASAAAYTTAASDLDNIVQTYWNPTLNTIQAIQNSGRQLDSSIPLGVIHGYNGDGVFAPESDKVLATLYQFALGMISEYPLNQNTLLDNHDKPMGVAIGRYYGDHYDGVGTASQGNPWHLTTTSFAEVYYRAALGFLSQGSIAVTDLNFPFLSGPRPMGLSVPNLTVGATLSASSAGFKAVISALKAVGDSYVRRSRFYQQADGHLAEEFNRDCGEMNGVNDLTWSYAAFLSASFARAELFAVNGED
ncbi:glycoside hydrolase 15 protein [Irineochytrium annulatum]|nr:glycoside hydrolase 15 protein [Irineochytrium annulatum]